MHFKWTVFLHKYYLLVVFFSGLSPHVTNLRQVNTVKVDFQKTYNLNKNELIQYIYRTVINWHYKLFYLQDKCAL